MQKEFTYCWQWQLESSPEALWPLAADTDRFDQDTGMQPVSALENDASLKNGRQRFRLSFLGVPIEWIQEPFEWEYPSGFKVVRTYQKGPIGRMQAQVSLNRREDGGTHLIYELHVRPRNIIGYLAIPVQIGILYQREFDRVFRHYDQLAQEQKQLDLGRNQLSTAEQKRLEQGLNQLKSYVLPVTLVDRLGEAVARLDDLSLANLRSHMLADEWGADRRQVLEMALYATRFGILDMRWELVCPSCRTSRASVTDLAETVNEVHCDTCQISFESDLSRSVELIFQPNSAIRSVPKNLKYCFAGPEDSPHIVIQQMVQPGETRIYPLNLEPGSYRMRTLDPPETVSVTVIDVADRKPSQMFHARMNQRGLEVDAAELAVGSQLSIENHAEEERLFFMERTRWSDFSVMAAEVIALQRFRDLFAEEVLRPGDQISVGSQTFVFTDLIGSTQMYNQIGDAPAFGLVLDHFEILQEEIDRAGGAVVKTIGDAVMGVFQKPAAALLAFQNARRRLSENTTPLQLRVGIHYGPAIAITLNNTLDYFGSTVNIAARLEGLSSGRDFVLSTAVKSDPEVQALITSGRLPSPQPFVAQLKGFDKQSFEVWRIEFD